MSGTINYLSSTLKTGFSRMTEASSPAAEKPTRPATAQNTPAHPAAAGPLPTDRAYYPNISSITTPALPGAEKPSLLQRISDTLSHSGPRYQSILRTYDTRKDLFNVNKHNHPFPAATVPYDAASDLPVKIDQPFKYTTFPPQFLTEDQRRVALVVQKEGGCDTWLEPGKELPCKEFVLVLDKNPESGIYEQSAKYDVGNDMHLDYSDWSKVTSFAVTDENTIQFNYFHASYNCGTPMDRAVTLSVEGTNLSATSATVPYKKT